MEVRHWTVDSLIPYINNARTHTPEQINKIASSIKEFGFNNPILIDSKKGIIAGHGRLEAAKLLGLAEVPTIELSHLSKAQKKAYILADNRMALDAGWDIDILKNEFENLIEENFDLTFTGFEEDEIENFLNPEILNEGIDEDNCPDVCEDAITKEGDLWILGNHRLLCGDCTYIDSVELLMNNKKADMVFTDPPYGIGTSIANDNLGIEDLKKFNGAWSPITFQFTKDDAHFVCFHSTRLFWTALDSLRQSGFEFTRYLTLYKPNDCTFPWQGWILTSESILLFTKGKPLYNKVSPYLHDTMEHLHGAEQKEDRGGHPCSKPTAFIIEFIKRFEAKTVLDIFGGTGSTLIACEKTNRNCYMMELDPKYCDVIIKRWQKFTGKKATLESTGEEFCG